MKVRKFESRSLPRASDTCTATAVYSLRGDMSTPVDERLSLLLYTLEIRMLLYHDSCCLDNNILMLPRARMARSRAQTKPSIYATLLRHKNGMIE